MPRHAFMVWLVIQNKMKTLDTLRTKGIIIVPKCCLCGTSDESVQHLFFECSYTNGVWTEIHKSRGFRRQPRGWDHEWCFIQHTCRSRSRSSQYIGAMFAAAIYFLWGERNRHIFTNVSSCKEAIVSQILHYLELQFG